MRELFIIGREAFASLSPEVVEATCSALKELNLFHLPYEAVDVQFLVDQTVRWVDKEGKFANEPGIEDGVNLHGFGDEVVIIYRGLSLNSCAGLELIDQKAGVRIDISDRVRPANTAAACAGLITLLATRNAMKKTKKNKLGALGIGKKWLRGNSYITTISLPSELEEDEEHPPTGAKRCPHLRRGHIRRQHYGPGNELVKKIWIAPVFVNADEGFVAQRQAYRV